MRPLNRMNVMNLELKKNEDMDVYDLDEVGAESDDFSGLTTANYVDRVHFERVAGESAQPTSNDNTSSGDPLYVYYRSMSKIPLLKREEEVYLAKKIESAKINMLRLLSRTPITSVRVLEIADRLNPAGLVAPETEPTLEERNQLKEKAIRQIVRQLKTAENRYRWRRPSKTRTTPRTSKKAGAPTEPREAVFRALSRIDFTEGQLDHLALAVQRALGQMSSAEREIRRANTVRGRGSRKRATDARAALALLEKEYKTTEAELRRIVELIRENKIEMGRAKDEFVRANLRLVLSIAKNYSYPGLDLLDLVQEGNIGLMKAVDKFNYRLGHKFSTYATWWIRQSITRAIADQGRTIRVPVHMVEAMNRVLKTSNELTKRMGRQPTVHELSKELKTPVAKVTQILKAAQDPISLEATIADNKDAVLNKFIEDKKAVAPDEDTLRHNLKDVTASALENLSPREQQIVRMRYGLNDTGKEYTLQEVGEVFQVTRERIRQIEEKALLKLRSPFRSNRLREFADFVRKN